MILKLIKKAKENFKESKKRLKEKIKALNNLIMLFYL
jgi:hypothetical protein